MFSIVQPGDCLAITPMPGTLRVVAHVVNDAGGWGRGFVLPLAQRWPHVEQRYRQWAAGTLGPFVLGMVQPVTAEPGIVVLNLLAQHGYSKPGSPALQYDALTSCLTKAQQWADARSCPVEFHLPRLGCGLAGGHWPRVESMLRTFFFHYDVRVYVPAS